ncbi:hypothetical protein NLG97_g8391 [Lecanicillium saksenae]|uniref:Uncharacterized protein n=1 Tax=Lecanicillium saksenae TaxID=468837 RepID=A0ACC1QKZ8_9HYPO|nr:hypothetical protein NLG97_g8391 [Lecanicillium saksenae]
MCTYAYFAKTGDGKNKSQYEMANLLYEPRAVDYDDSWHPDYTRRLIDFVGVRPDDRVLSLACGTGLEAVHCAPKISDRGTIIGIDATKAMLAVAQTKFDADPILKQRVQLIQHDIADLGSCSALEKNSFDLIICSNAFVLLEKRDEIIAQWTEYLKPGGRMAIDIPSEQSIPEGTMMETICARLDVQYASDRSWMRSIDSFRTILEAQGLGVKSATVMEKRPGQDVKYLDKVKLQTQFEKVVVAALASKIIDDDFREKAMPLFDEEWNRLGVDGKVRVCESLYLYIAEKQVE